MNSASLQDGYRSIGLYWGTSEPKLLTSYCSLECSPPHFTGVSLPGGSGTVHLQVQAALHMQQARDQEENAACHLILPEDSPFILTMGFSSSDSGCILRTNLPPFILPHKFQHLNSESYKDCFSVFTTLQSSWRSLVLFQIFQISFY